MASDYDSPWKEAITQHFQQFLEYFFAEIHADVDWFAGYEFLDSELQAIISGAQHGRRFADRLVRVRRRSGKHQLVLIHVEVQSQVDRQFGRRMLLYHSRIFDRFGLDLCSLAILGDTDPNWRPQGRRRRLWGCLHQLRFPVRKLLDYPDTVSQTTNPFAWLTAGHRQAQATRRHPKKRAAAKSRMVRGLYTCGLSIQQIRELFRLLDWLLALPEDLEYAFRQDLARFEEENSMPYVTSIERLARKEGREEGLEAGQEIARDQACRSLRQEILARYQVRWGQPPDRVAAQLEQLQDLQQLVSLLGALVTAATPTDWLPDHQD